jgi:flagellar basal body-associated protein FliL
MQYAGYVIRQDGLIWYRKGVSQHASVTPHRLSPAHRRPHISIPCIRRMRLQGMQHAQLGRDARGVTQGCQILLLLLIIIIIIIIIRLCLTCATLTGNSQSRKRFAIGVVQARDNPIPYSLFPILTTLFSQPYSRFIYCEFPDRHRELAPALQHYKNGRSVYLHRSLLYHLSSLSTI